MKKSIVGVVGVQIDRSRYLKFGIAHLYHNSRPERLSENVKMGTGRRESKFINGPFSGLIYESR